jgi:hypothetical protein
METTATSMSFLRLTHYNAMVSTKLCFATHRDGDYCYQYEFPASHTLQCDRLASLTYDYEMEYKFLNVNKGKKGGGISVCGMARSDPHHRKV